MKPLNLSRTLAGLVLAGLSWQASAGCTTTAWSSTTTYQGGELVAYQGSEYKARYWINPGQSPNPSNQWDAWQFMQACGTTGSSTSSAATSSSVSTNSSVSNAGGKCNWYGSTYSICQQTTAGWGWENNQSCIAYADCAALSAPYGVITASSAATSNSVSTSSSKPSSTSTSTSVSTSKPSSTSSATSTSSKTSTSSATSTSSSKPSSTSTSVSTSSVATSSSSGNLASWTYDASVAQITAPATVINGVGQLQGSGSAVLWNFTAPAAGEYRVSLTWSAPYGVKANTLIMDGTASSYTFDSMVPAVYTRAMNLSAGNHSFGISVGSSDWGYMNAHSLKVDLLGSLTISSPANFAQLPSGSSIQVAYDKQGSGRLTYSINDSTTVVYTGTSPLIIPTSGDGIYRLKLSVEGTGINQNLRVSVGNTNHPTFVETAGTQFVLGSRPFYFSGSNQYYLMYKPEAMANDFFDRAAALNMNVVRTWMFCNDNTVHDGVCINMKSGDSFILSKPEAQRTAAEQAIIKRSFELFDNYVAQAEARGIRLVLALGDHWNYFGNIDAYGGYGSANGRVLYKNFITNLLNHTNAITGVAYKNDPTIMMWELANEPRVMPDLATFKDWVHDIAAHVKSVAPNQLISIGMESSFGFASNDTYATLVDINKDANVNAISAHLYPTWWSMSDAQALSNIQQLADLAREVGKPAYIGEFSWPVNEQRTSASATQTVKLSSYTDQSAVDAFVQVSLQQRATYMESWYAKAWANRDAIGGMLIWQLSGKEWGNGGVPLRGCQWCAGPYGEPTNGWTANNDAFQFYCALNDSEYSLTQLGAAGANTEGNIIHMLLHKPACDVVKNYSVKYQSLMQ